MTGKLTLIHVEREDEDAYALRFGRYILTLLESIDYGYVQITKHAGSLHGLQVHESLKVPDELKQAV